MKKVTPTNTEPKLKLFEQVIDEENKYRELYAQERDSAVLADPHLMMIDAHANMDVS